MEAAKKGEVCLKCNPGAEAKLALAKQFDKDSCCAKAFAEGKWCDHPCCVEAREKGEVMFRSCKPGAEGKRDQLCGSGGERGGLPGASGAEAKLAWAKFDKDSCCDKAFKAGKWCDHPCCVEAREKGEVCTKCNPGDGKKDLTALFDPDSCCAKACAAGKACEHPCCVEAAAKGEVCLKCNPGAKEKLEKEAAPAEESPPADGAPAPEPKTEPSDNAKVAAVPAKTLEFNRSIRPILSDNCLQCHGFDKEARKAKLRLDVRDSAVEVRGDHAPIVPGDAAASELVRRITTKDPLDVMPPPDSGFKLEAGRD